MPAKVIATVHQLAAACKNQKGIVFMDKAGNFINDDNDNDNYGYDDTLEITGVDTNDNILENTEEHTEDNTQKSHECPKMQQKTWKRQK